MARSCGLVSFVLARIPMAILMAILCFFLATNMTHAWRRPSTYYVGGVDGWDMAVGGAFEEWASSKTFYAGDILVFKYDPQDYNVWAVNRTGYETCIANAGATLYEDGNDRIRLPYGYSYYICLNQPEDCSAGMKMEIKALAPN